MLVSKSWPKAVFSMTTVFLDDTTQQVLEFLELVPKTTDPFN